jgi:16S rRNA (guanine527-N7)-methyltransferase
MLRRTTWLSSTIDDLALTNCTVHRGRAEEFHGVLSLPFATARAVARIDRLARWTFPLLRDGGTLVALKGGRVEEELIAEEAALRRLGMTSSAIRRYGEDVLEVPTVALELTVGRAPAAPAPRGRGDRGTKPKRGANRR